MPEHYLLILAAHGNMGDGEVPGLMRLWAEGECERLGLAQQMGAERERNLKLLEERLANVIGQQDVDRIKRTIDTALDKLMADMP